MQKTVKLIFHRRGLRSYIDVDLCAECPRQDNKGCCGHYSPVFYLTDLWWVRHQDPSLFEYIASLPRLTILDASITINSIPEEDGSYHCQFHTLERGCILPNQLRESVCRHFVCPGIGWWQESNLSHWRKYFDQLSEFEINLNQRLAELITKQGLSLRNPGDWEQIFHLVESNLDPELFCQVPIGLELPGNESVSLKRTILLGTEWKL